MAGNWDGFVTKTLEASIRELIKELKKRGVQKDALEPIKTHLKQHEYINAFDRCLDYTFGMFEDDEEMMRTSRSTCGLLAHYLKTAGKTRGVNGWQPHQIIKASQFYVEVYDSLHEYRATLLQQHELLSRWQQQKQLKFTELEKMEARKFAEKLVNMVLQDMSSQKQETLIDALATHLQLKFVPKDTVIYNEKTVGESVYFVALGSVGFYNSPTSFFPHDIKRSGSVCFTVLCVVATI